MNDKLVRKYANTLARVGMNVQKGQNVMIESAIENYWFANMVMEECFKLGAHDVNISYLDMDYELIKSKYLTVDEISSVKDYERQTYKGYLYGDCVTIRLESEYPYLLDNVNDDISHAIFKHIDDLRNIMRAYSRDKKLQWCIAIVPNQRWAEAIFPNDDKKIVLDKFWDVLFKLCLIDDENDPLEAWKSKINRIHELGKKIDELNIKTLHYTSSNGTNLYVGLTKESKFYSEEECSGMYNLPTEEIYTTPDKYSINGHVCTTKPLLIGGKKIPYFELDFKNGKIINVKAPQGEEMLRSTINTDAGSCYLGEVALVGYHTPISMSGLVYYTTLIDENASCHLALGRSVSDGSCILEDGLDHFNDSSIHIDFMIGAKDTNIIGITWDGKEIPIFKDGDFAIDK